ncbi:hypothetical protein KP79_PYT13666 [Mizuhopecten yessoensis]|uniref:Uncharacterized protein n=2 Tax=Mizuhopecten yessoensis TaxID=6573 RepID=A0A210QXV4_MIZYE|nr:hypothetical protein KP79_PYT13666 [Mizuhopecten yessoensis]
MCVIPVPIIAIKRLLQTPGTLKEKIMTLVAPSRKWGPNDDGESLSYKMYKYKGGIWRTIRINLCGTRN